MHEKLEKLEKLKKLFDDGIISEEEYSDLKKDLISNGSSLSGISIEKAQPVNCSSCGAANQMPSDKKSMYCAYCGGIIERKTQISEPIKTESPLKSKPKISKRKTKITSKKREGSVGAMHWTGDYSTKRRVDGGFEMYDGLSWKFVPDEIEEEEEVINEGGELNLKNRGLTSLKEIVVWFSDNELSEIKRMDLTGNHIKDFEGINSFSNLTELDLSSNDINVLPTENQLSNKIHNIILKNNPIAKQVVDKNIKKSSKITIIETIPCSKCGCKRTSEEEGSYGNYCWNCYKEKLNKKKSEETIKAMVNDPLLKKAFQIKQPSFFQLLGREMGGDCFIATATMGSYDHPVVVELRLFRDNWILQKSWGYGFVRWYYHYGAMVAKFIEKSFFLKKISYLLIVKPLYIISKRINRK
jgi:hypothetical protein